MRMRLTEQERIERSQQLQKTLMLLVHACKCHDVNCSSSSCRKVCAHGLPGRRPLNAAMGAMACELAARLTHRCAPLLTPLAVPQVRQLFQHAVACQQKVTGGCHMCKKMWCLLNLHAKSCTESDCPVPRCK
jgi:E1A/CREB-binding protein